MTEATWQRQCEAHIGRTQSQTDAMSPQAANLFLATLNEPPELKDGDALPALYHWMYFHRPIQTGNLKTDGHEKMGLFLPPVRYPRRMWAGSKVTFHAPLVLGMEAKRSSTIKSVTFKTGKSGPLCFVEIEHVCVQDGLARLTEVQTLVYREPGEPASLARHLPETPEGEGWQSVNSIVLFRYSALTFNSHRIHYDHDYVRDVEGYPGLVVHGPLMATLMMRYAQGLAACQQPARFSFRGLAPLFENEPFRIDASESNAVTALSLSKADGKRCVAAEVGWQSTA
jgi:3-methylfumaryl-CoA hydratase